MDPTDIHSNGQPLTEFALFSTLPIELRLRIWQVIMEIQLGYAIHIDHTRKTGFILKSARPYPLIGFTCHDAAFALSKLMVPLFKSEKIRPQSSDIRVRIIPDKDTIIIRELSNETMYWFVESLNYGMAAQIRHMGLIHTKRQSVKFWPTTELFKILDYMLSVKENFPNLIDYRVVRLCARYRKRQAAIFKFESGGPYMWSESLKRMDSEHAASFIDYQVKRSRDWWRMIGDRATGRIVDVVAESMGGDTSGTVVIKTDESLD
jgi:hypothetical protein